MGSIDGRLGSITYIVLAYVNAFGTNRRRHVNAIIYDQWYVVFLRDVVKILGRSDQLSSIGGLVSILDNRSAWNDSDQTLLWPREFDCANLL